MCGMAARRCTRPYVAIRVRLRSSSAASSQETQRRGSPAGRAQSKRALEKLHLELMELNPSATRSLEEGREETVTAHRLRVPDQLRRTLSSTNVIESAFSIVETV